MVMIMREILSSEAKKALKDFKCEKIRMREESFAKMFSGRNILKLSLIDCNEAYTDGKSITIDPAWQNIFCNKSILAGTERCMELGSSPWSKDRFQALCLITRALNIHECLHLIYTRFPPMHLNDERLSSLAKRKAFGKLANIIEDAYIEAAGCFEFDNLEFYLKFINTSIALMDLNYAFSPERKAGGEKLTGEYMDDSEKYKATILAEYMHKCLAYLIYPPSLTLSMPRFDPTAEQYFANTKHLLDKAVLTPSPEGRYNAEWKIFEAIKDIIPETDAALELFCSLMPNLPGVPSHDENDMFSDFQQGHGRECRPERMLFRLKNGTPNIKSETGRGNCYVLEKSEEYGSGTGSAAAGIRSSLISGAEGFSDISSFLLSNAVLYDSIHNESDNGERIKYYTSADFDCAGVHQGIRMIVRRPALHMHLKPAYNNIVRMRRQTISKYSSALQRMINAETRVTEEKLLFGSAISSKRLGDLKRRYWEKKADAEGIPSMSILFLVDNSGSMSGGRIMAAKNACIIMHEVLKRNDIPHAVVSEEAIYEKPLVEHRILIGFNGREEEKYSILSMNPRYNTREGFSLYWAEKYINEHTDADIKLIIVIADGWPLHEYARSNYIPPVSTKDTANAAHKIMKRGTEIVAVALGDPDACDADFNECLYDLKNIYPSVAACRDADRLPVRLFEQIAVRLKTRKF